eukprot:8274696-Pyramimonas_sp.AAC.2
MNENYPRSQFCRPPRYRAVPPPAVPSVMDARVMQSHRSCIATYLKYVIGPFAGQQLLTPAAGWRNSVGSLSPERPAGNAKSGVVEGGPDENLTSARRL